MRLPWYDRPTHPLPHRKTNHLVVAASHKAEAVFHIGINANRLAVVLRQAIARSDGRVVIVRPFSQMPQLDFNEGIDAVVGLEKRIGDHGDFHSIAAPVKGGIVEGAS